MLDRVAGVRSARSLRCSCHEYRMLAMGQADFAVNSSCNPWDHAAGALILREAGGRVVMADGTAYDPSQRHGWLIAAGSPEGAETIRALGWEDLA